MENRTILITGATSGVGKATAFALADSENHLLLVARSKSKGEQVIQEILERQPKAKVEIFIADLAIQKEIKKIATEINTKFDRIDVLINCAGVVSSARAVTSEGIENTLAVNYLSHYLLSHLLLERIKKSKQGRIINVASLIPPVAKINFGDIHSKNKYNGVKAYLQSKVADVMFTYDLAEQLKETNVTVNAVHPGIVKTNLGVDTSIGLLQGFVRFCMSFVAISPEKSAERILYLTNSNSLSKISGKYFKSGQKPVSTNSFSYDTDNRKKLFEMTQQLIIRES